MNPRFGDTRGARTLVREPFRVTLDFSFELSTDYNVQELRRALEPVKVGRAWERRTADSLAAFYLSNTSNIHTALLTESDSLFLTPAQVAQLRVRDSVYSEQVRAIYVPLGRFLATMPSGAAGKAALDSVAAARKAYWKVFWRQPEIADSALTSLQRELMPMLKNMLQITPKEREGSQWFFGSPVKFKAEKPAVSASRQAPGASS